MASQFYDRDMRPRRFRALQAGACYFMVTLTLAWFFGPIRDFWVRSGADPLFAVLCQAVATLLALVWAAGWVVQAFDVPRRLGDHAIVGFGAMGLLIVCDLFAGWLMYGLPPWVLVAHFLGAEGVVIGLSLLIAALLPLFRGYASRG
ncbi:MAG: hypothetical protein JSS35_10925 [Proteobacteria bacterium]|nr:hypothetical protein [Pseudomonadota bacterium]